MRIRDYITLARLNIKGNKKHIINSIVLVVISLIILFLSSLIYNSVHEYKDRTISKNNSYRIIGFMTYESMTYDGVCSSLENVKHIAKIVEGSCCRTGCNVTAIDNAKIDGFISFYGANEDTSPAVIKGRNFNRDEEDVCIIPRNFYPYSSGENDTYESLKKHFINGEDLIGKEIELELHSVDISDPDKAPVITITGSTRVKVIGVYDTFDNMGYEDECYISYNNIKQINSSVTSTYNTNSTFSEWAVIPDRYANANEILLDVCKVFPSATLGGVFHIEAVNAICFMGFALAICLIIIAFINILTVTIKRIADKTGEIGMLKSMGYTNSHILGIYEMENLISGLISFIIMAILSVVIIIAAKIIIMNSSSEIAKLPIIVGYKVYLIAFIAGVIIPIIATWFAGRRVTRIPAGIAIKEE